MGYLILTPFVNRKKIIFNSRWRQKKSCSNRREAEILNIIARYRRPSTTVLPGLKKKKMSAFYIHVGVGIYTIMNARVYWFFDEQTQPNANGRRRVRRRVVTRVCARAEIIYTDVNSTLLSEETRPANNVCGTRASVKFPHRPGTYLLNSLTR